MPRLTLRSDERGLSFVEYLIILCVVALLGFGAWKAFGGALAGEVTAASDDVSRIQVANGNPTQPIDTSGAPAANAGSSEAALSGDGVRVEVTSPTAGPGSAQTRAGADSAPPSTWERVTSVASNAFGAVMEALVPAAHAGESHTPESFLAEPGRVAVVYGPEVLSMREVSSGGFIRGTGLRIQRDNPGSDLISFSEIDADGQALRDYDTVILVTHGAPDGSMWGGHRVGYPGQDEHEELEGYEVLSGQGLGELIHDEGFRGDRILLDSCNSGTESVEGGSGTSTAQHVADRTGATVMGARADDAYVGDVLSGEPRWESIDDGRVATPDDIGKVIVQPNRTDAVGLVEPSHVGQDLSEAHPGHHLADSNSGVVLTTGDLNSDVNPNASPYRQDVPNGSWAVFEPTDANTGGGFWSQWGVDEE